MMEICLKKPTIAIIGAGHMGSSLAAGLLANDYPKENLWVTDLDLEKLKNLSNQLHIHTTTNNLEAVQQAEVVILAVKPQILAPVVKNMAEKIQEHKPLIISIAAGVRENSIQKWLGGDIAIVRAMPNTPALLGCGASALFANDLTSDSERSLAETILRAVGIAVWIEDEKLMDVITALSGSGPAYFFLVMEALQKAAIELGLPKETARMLTLQTAFGSARMALESDTDIIELRKGVTSPGGTTERALEVLEENIHDIFKKALGAAKKRSEELAEMLETKDF